MRNIISEVINLRVVLQCTINLEIRSVADLVTLDDRLLGLYGNLGRQLPIMPDGEDSSETLTSSGFINLSTK